MSVKYNLFKLAVKASGVKKRTSKPVDELVRMSREKQAKNPFYVPDDDDEFEYSDHPQGRSHCLRIHPRTSDSQRAIIYAYGGGMMMPPATRYYDYAKKLAVATQSDVWFPRYPLCSDATILEAVQMVYGIWHEVSAAYEAGSIAFYGFSSGASILLSALLYNAEQAEPLENPSIFIGIAPGGCPADASEALKMRALDSKDIEVSYSFMDSMRELMSKGDASIPSYMIDGTGGTWEALPPTYLYYGSNEVLSAKAPAFDRKLEEAGVPHAVTIRPDMCHCYCISPLIPEGKADYDTNVHLLRSALGSPSASSLTAETTGAASGNKPASDVTFWDRTAFAYDLAMRKGDEGVARAASFAASFMSSTDIVLDAACGTGAFACAIAPRVGFVAACDLSDNMLARTHAKADKLKLANIGFGKSDITALDFDDDTFDAAIAGNVLHLLDDPQAAVDELVRVVKADGIIVVPNYYVEGDPADKRFVKAATAIGFPLKSDWRRADFLEFLERAGLEIVEQRTFEGARPLCVAICSARPRSE